ncbi:MAG: transposase [bacterium]
MALGYIIRFNVSFSLILLYATPNIFTQLLLYSRDYFNDLKGLTPLNMAVLISEGGLTRTFKDEGHFASYCGQAPRQYQSASMNKFISSPNYNRYMAKTMHFLACQNVLKSGSFHDDYIEAKKHYSRKLRALKKIKRHICRMLFYKLMTYRLHLISVKNIKTIKGKPCVA